MYANGTEKLKGTKDKRETGKCPHLNTKLGRLVKLSISRLQQEIEALKIVYLYFYTLVEVLV